MDVLLQIETPEYAGQEDPRFLITLLPVEQPVPTVAPVQDPFCSFCLRERPLDGAFYGYNIENCPILRETMEDIFGPKFKLEKFSICTPCWNLVQLMDDFRTCCFEANSCAERVKRGLKCEDGWFTQDTVKGIEAMHSAIRTQIERIKKIAVEEIHEQNSINDVITIEDSDSDDELDSPKLVIDDEPLEEIHSSEDAIEMPQEIDQSTIETSTTNVDKAPEEQQPKLDDAEDGIETNVPQEIPTYSIKIEAEELEPRISDENSMQLVFEEQRAPLLDRADTFVEEDAAGAGASKQPEILIHNIKTEVMLPDESMDAEYNQPKAQEDHVEAHEAEGNENLFTEISIENIKVEKDEVGEKIAKLLNARVSQCGRCGSSFKNKRGLIIHVKQCKHQTAVGPDVMYTCQICWVSYRSKTNFKAHINQHIDYKPYKCRLRCKKYFFGLRGRMKHEAKCNQFICCTVCDHTFPDKESLFAHIKSAHGKIIFHCKICEIKFGTKMGLKKHSLNLHTERAGDFPCRRCNQHVAKTGYEANLHTKECRLNFTFDCVLCGVRLHTALLLKAHMAAIHEEPKYSCDVCGKKFKHEATVMKHQKTHANRKLKIPCSQCHKIFSTPHNLKRHMMQHCTVVCPYPCPSCNKRFSSKSAMRKHFKMICSIDKIVCQYCRKKYVLRSSLEKHIEKKHSKHLRSSPTDSDSQTQEIYVVE